jgi:hypothetical protein
MYINFHGTNSNEIKIKKIKKLKKADMISYFLTNTKAYDNLFESKYSKEIEELIGHMDDEKYLDDNKDSISTLLSNNIVLKIYENASFIFGKKFGKIIDKIEDSELSFNGVSEMGTKISLPFILGRIFGWEEDRLINKTKGLNEYTDSIPNSYLAIVEGFISFNQNKVNLTLLDTCKELNKDYVKNEIEVVKDLIAKDSALKNKYELEDLFSMLIFTMTESTSFTTKMNTFSQNDYFNTYVYISNLLKSDPTISIDIKFAYEKFMINHLYSVLIENDLFKENPNLQINDLFQLSKNQLDTFELITKLK